MDVVEEMKNYEKLIFAIIIEKLVKLGVMGFPMAGHLSR